jgi:hypothetical protein
MLPYSYSVPSPHIVIKFQHWYRRCFVLTSLSFVAKTVSVHRPFTFLSFCSSFVSDTFLWILIQFSLSFRRSHPVLSTRGLMRIDHLMHFRGLMLEHCTFSKNNLSTLSKFCSSLFGNEYYQHRRFKCTFNQSEQFLVLYSSKTFEVIE